MIFNLTPHRSRLISSRGFTLPEILLSTGIFVFLMAGLLSSHIFGIKLFEISKAKLVASEDARKAVSMMVTEIRNAKILRIGSGTLTSFSEVGVNSNQVGSAIQIYPTTNTNTYVRYFWSTVDKKLKRTTNGTSAFEVIANSVSNQMVFSAEDYAGNILTNNENNRVISLLLQFYQLENPLIPIGPGNYYDYYQLRTKITRRTLE